MPRDRLSVGTIAVVLWLSSSTGCCLIKSCGTYTQEAESERFGIKGTFEEDKNFRYIVIAGNIKGHIPLASDTGHRRSLAIRLPTSNGSAVSSTAVVEGVMVTFRFKNAEVARVVDANLKWLTFTTDRAQLEGSVMLRDPQGQLAELKIDPNQAHS